MAFRLNYQGALIETDTVAEVQALLLAFAEPVQRMLPPASPIDVVPAEAPPAGAGRPKAGVALPRANRREAPPVSARSALEHRGGDSPLQSRILEQLKGGQQKPGVLWRRLGVASFAGRCAIKPLVKAGRVVASGKTMSRVFALAGRPKEGL